MPTYVYECAKCGDEFELWQSFSDEPLKKHPGCGGKVVKVLQPVGIVLKGSGFYKNDSRNGGGRKKSDAGSKADSASKNDSKSDSKSESKSESSGSNDSSSSSSSDSKSDSTKSGDKKISTPASKPA